MELEVASVVIFNGTAYLPSWARIPQGMWWQIEPVLEASLTQEDLVRALREMQRLGNPVLAENPTSPGKPSDSPLLRATRARSHKALAAQSTSYSIDWRSDAVRIEMSHLDKKGRWEYDMTRGRDLPADTPLEEIARIILEDARKQGHHVLDPGSLGGTEPE